MHHNLIIPVLLISLVSSCFSSKRAADNKVTVPLNGPCILNNEPKLKCTDKGYYEMVQCDPSGCYCVNPQNGQMAFSTKTDSSKKVPTCSQCFQKIRTMVSGGTSATKEKLPVCDSDLGDYKKIQCDVKEENCSCVDVKTGKELPGTKQSRKNNNIIKCPGDAKLHDPQSNWIPVGQEYCRIDRDLGQKCSNASSQVMYYFDITALTCLAFNYKGCGGNKNRFATKSACYSGCMLPDYSGCSGLAQPAVNSKNQSYTCGGMSQPMLPPPPPGVIVATTTKNPLLNDEGCPHGSKCVMGAFFGFCCNAANEERYNRAWKPSCPKGTPYAIEQDGWKDTVFGKSCKDEFCPISYQCQQGDIWAHCCPK